LMEYPIVLFYFGVVGNFWYSEITYVFLRRFSTT
jgi:hypothetical protein